WIHNSKWTIKNPACSLNNVSRGANAQVYSAGINEMVKYFSDGNANYNSSLTVPHINYWNILRDPSNPAYQNEDNLHMAMSIAAVGNGWSTLSFSSLMDLAKIHNWYIYPVLNALLHNHSINTTQMDSIEYWSEKMLFEAPLSGPYSSYPQTNSHGYAVNLRFLHETSKQYLGNNNSGGQKFSGLDYMLLHNLYFLASTSLVGMEENKKSIISSVYPLPFNDYLKLDISTENSIDYMVEIYNIQGKTLFRKKMK